MIDFVSGRGGSFIIPLEGGFIIPLGGSFIIPLEGSFSPRNWKKQKRQKAKTFYEYKNPQKKQYNTGSATPIASLPSF